MRISGKLVRIVAMLVASSALLLAQPGRKPSPFPSRNPKAARSVKAPPPKPVAENEDVLDKPPAKEATSPVATTPSAPVQAAAVGVARASSSNRSTAPKVPAPAPVAKPATAAAISPATESTATDGATAAPAASQQAPEPAVISPQALACRATFYGANANGARTASGEALNNEELTVAHGSLPFGTTVRLVNIANGKVVTARVNDRIRSGDTCRLNVTLRIARDLGFVVQGSAQLALERLP
jgi:rare lipoprotein A